MTETAATRIPKGTFTTADQFRSGVVFNVQKFCLHDGPGIRTTVFLKGCPLACAWCSNPEAQALAPQEIRDLNSADENAATTVGRYTCVSDVVDECMKDKDFYDESGGGVTLSGGEALYQPRFALNLLRQLQLRGVHTAVETTAFVSPKMFKRFIPYVDLFLIDVKHHDRDSHKKWTGVGTRRIHANIAAAIYRGKDVLVRIPVIPGVNDSLDDAQAFCELFHRLGVTRVQLLPFHQFGERKYQALGLDYQFTDVPSLHPEDLLDYEAVFLKNGIHASF